MAIAIISFFISGCSLEEDQDANPVIKTAYDSLSRSEKSEIKGDWKKAILKEATVSNHTGVLTNQHYDGKEAYIIIFYTGDNHSIGDIDVYVSKDKLKVIGKGYRD
ncbi:hypothetical protein CN378_13415 [Bacillus sp. AFS015802]|uniref:hypothetical protein n=1 Tax=Bacillus sp. AFS015802 TaxID=2033486 RepID=UPI000BF61200|nr:hypothetical protein [Bacillus sp. AFS015802]PFA66717.1 hypothetical protein CN378_13415 [Bacillus sp. AFS015802]